MVSSEPSRLSSPWSSACGVLVLLPVFLVFAFSFGGAALGGLSQTTTGPLVGAGAGLHSAASGITASLSINPGSVQEGQSISVSTTASGGTRPYSFAYSGLPPGCTGQNQASFSCNPSSTGSYNVQVSVTDSRGNQSNPSNSVPIDVTSSNSGNGNGNGNNSSNGLSSLFSGFSGFLSLFLIVGVVGFATWILMLVAVWIIAITLLRRLPKRGSAGGLGATTNCAACSASVPAGSKFCAECGARVASK